MSKKRRRCHINRQGRSRGAFRNTPQNVGNPASPTEHKKHLTTLPDKAASVPPEVLNKRAEILSAVVPGSLRRRERSEAECRFEGALAAVFFGVETAFREFAAETLAICERANRRQPEGSRDYELIQPAVVVEAILASRDVFGFCERLLERLKR